MEKEIKKKLLMELLKNMQERMAKGLGDEVMSASEVEDEVSEAGEVEESMVTEESDPDVDNLAAELASVLGMGEDDEEEECPYDDMPSIFSLSKPKKKVSVMGVSVGQMKPGKSGKRSR